MDPKTRVLLDRVRSDCHKVIEQKLELLEKKLQEERKRLLPNHVENVVTVVYL